MNIPVLPLCAIAVALLALLIALVRHRRVHHWSPAVTERDEHLDLWGIG
ncbi:hypothetical protein [uncultured Thiodictyon sp.]|nr:hypothetical protein [uncultured Thiodictyon sp.]